MVVHSLVVPWRILQIVLDILTGVMRDPCGWYVNEISSHGPMDDKGVLYIIMNIVLQCFTRLSLRQKNQDDDYSDHDVL